MKYSVATTKGYVVKLVRLLFIAFKNKKTTSTTPMYTKYAILVHRLAKHEQGIDDENSLNENEEGRCVD